MRKRSILRQPTEGLLTRPLYRPHSATKQHHLCLQNKLRSVSKGLTVYRCTIRAGQQMPTPTVSKKKVLFVCLGNICRSPTAEAVFKAVVERNGLSEQFEIDSCGTGGGSSNWYRAGGYSYHEGDPADSRMTGAAAARGVTLTSISRPLCPEDLERFDHIIGMDTSNITAIKRAAEHWKSNRSLNVDYMPKLSLMTEHFTSNSKFKSTFDHVPDPYYGGNSGFETVLDLLEDACEGLLQTIL